MTSSRSKKILKTLIKVAIVLLLLVFLTRKGLLSLSGLRRALESPGILATVLLLSVLSTFLGIFRWRLLLRGQGIALSWRRVVQLSLIGNFFNLALPGAVSGDLVKAIYIAREHPGRRGHALGSILFDRIVGVSGLVVISAAALLVGFGTLHRSGIFQAVEGFVLVSATVVLIFFGYLFFMPERHDPVRAALDWLQARFGRLSSLTHIYEGVRNYHRHRWISLQAILTSCLIHLLAATSCLLFTIALDPLEAERVSHLGLYALAPLGLLATAVPLAPAGIGTGHAAFGWLFLLLGSQAGANVFSLFVLYQLLWSALGGLVYLRYRSEIPAPTAQLASE